MEKKMENEMETEGIWGFEGLGFRVPQASVEGAVGAGEH